MLATEKLAVLQPGLDAVGLDNAGGPASFFRWLAVPKGWEAAEWTRRARRDPLTARLIDVLTDGSGSPGDIGAASAHASATFAGCLLQAGIMSAPGGFFGPVGEGYVRLALVPTIEDCATARDRLIALASAP